MPRAIATDTAPSVRKFTNIPQTAAADPDYEFHEIDPETGAVVTDPVKFAELETARQKSHPSLEMSYTDFAETVKAEMGDPYRIDVRAEAVNLMKTQEEDIFNEWSGGQYNLRGFLPKNVKKKWGEYKQRILANAEKMVTTDKEGKISDYEHRLAEWKTNRNILLEKIRKTGKGSAKVTGSLTEGKVIDMIEDMTFTPEDARNGIRKFHEELKEDSPKGRREALRKVMDWIDEQEKVDPVADVSPPKGFTDTGRTSGGKKVYISADGTKAWVQP